MRPISRILVSILSIPLVAPLMMAQSAPPAADTYTRSSQATSNFGAQTTLQVRSGYNSYVQFNLAPVPTGTTVAKATLRLFVDSVNTAGSFNLFPVTSAWTESGLTWNTAPTLGTSLGSTSIATSSANQFIVIDVTSLVQGWLTTPSTNYGVSLQLVGGTGQFDFDSKEAPGGFGGVLNTGHEPELEIALNGPTGAQGPIGPAGPTGSTGPIGPAGSTG